MNICREYTKDDIPFLQEMLFEAVFWSRTVDNRPSLEDGLSYDYTKHILLDFGNRNGDTAVIAQMDGVEAGAAFIRYWNDDINMRGYIAKDIPVLVVGVAQAFRRQGIGGKLIKAIKEAAQEKNISKISLCVTKNNIAYQLYIKQGFTIVEDIETSFNMLWDASK